MGFISFTTLVELKIAICLLSMLILTTSCTQLTPPLRATPEQARERQSESPSSDTIKARPGGPSKELCAVNFDDPLALGLILAQARDNFATKTGRSTSGRAEPCDPSSHSDCWMYRQRCSQHDINVEDINYGHFHLSFELPTCLIRPGVDVEESDPGDGHGWGFGRRTADRCLPINWAFEPRVVHSHASDHWIRIWLSDSVSRTPMYFDMSNIWVVPSDPIQLWFRKRDGTWWFWPELGPGRIWNVSEWIQDVSEVRIRGSDSFRGPYGIGAFTIRD